MMTVTSVMLNMTVTSVMRVQQVWLARLNETLAPFELTFARYEALMRLYRSRTGALPLGKIGVRLQVHPTSVTNLIDGLEKLGYAARTPTRRIAEPSWRQSPTVVATWPRRRLMR
jgi:DNA-binding MarR family transcriptional regulator